MSHTAPSSACTTNHHAPATKNSQYRGPWRARGNARRTTFEAKSASPPSSSQPLATISRAKKSMSASGCPAARASTPSASATSEGRTSRGYGSGRPAKPGSILYAIPMMKNPTNPTACRCPCTCACSTQETPMVPRSAAVAGRLTASARPPNTPKKNASPINGR